MRGRSRQLSVLFLESTDMTGNGKRGEEERAPIQSDLGQRLGENIQARRKMLKLTQAALAERLEVDTETLSRFERGKHLPSLVTLERLATILETTAADLLAKQAGPVADDAVAVSVWMAKLGESDRDFVRELVKFQCDHLLRRKGSAGQSAPRPPGSRPRNKKSVA
jgi:transcriptional regulator with XRE-family HTH domain